MWWPVPVLSVFGHDFHNLHVAWKFGELNKHLQSIRSSSDIPALWKVASSTCDAAPHTVMTQTECRSFEQPSHLKSSFSQ